MTDRGQTKWKRDHSGSRCPCSWQAGPQAGLGSAPDPSALAAAAPSDHGGQLARGPPLFTQERRSGKNWLPLADSQHKVLCFRDPVFIL